jgi:hypothetical protein
MIIPIPERHAPPGNNLHRLSVSRLKAWLIYRAFELRDAGQHSLRMMQGGLDVRSIEANVSCRGSAMARSPPSEIRPDRRLPRRTRAGWKHHIRLADLHLDGKSNDTWN